MGDSMTDFIAGVEAADERRDIDADFAHLREIMESRSFRTNSGLAGEQPYYIYDYPPRQELEVAEHIRQLVSQLQTMTPKYDGDYAPQVLTLDLFDVVLEILGIVAFWIVCLIGRQNATEKSRRMRIRISF